MSHVHGLKKPKPRPTRPTRPRCRVQPEGPVLKDHLLATSATSEPTDPRCGKDGVASSPFETAVLTKISKQNCGDFGFYVFFWGLLWKWQIYANI